MNSDFDLASYQYDLPSHLIAQVPAETREQSRLLVLDCRQNILQDKKFLDIIDFLDPGDLLVVNDTRVFPARLEGKKSSGGKMELFLLEYPDFNNTRVFENSSYNITGSNKQCVTVTGLVKSSKKPGIGSHFYFNQYLEAELLEHLGDGKVRVRLCFNVCRGMTPEKILISSGRIPLPPYIRRNDQDHPEDRERYQTIFADRSGAVAAPTAGLHFSEPLLQKLRRKGIRIAPITLHVGFGTFSPVRANDIRHHKIHEEYIEISSETAEMINQTRKTGKRIWAVGTTTVRTLEFGATESGEVQRVKGWCGLYIYPGYRFKVITGLITNFHLPRSSLLFLVAALTGRSRILRVYNEAIRLGYRFYSYGDAMIIIC